MAINLEILGKLAPPDTTPEDLELAAEQYDGTNDMYAAAATLWDWYALAMPQPDAPEPGAVGAVASMSQGDQSVTYAASASTDPWSLYSIRQNQATAKARSFWARSKPSSVLLRAETRQVYDSRSFAYELGFEGPYIAIQE